MVAAAASLWAAMTLAGAADAPRDGRAPSLALPAPVACRYRQQGRWRLSLGAGARFAEVEGTVELSLPVVTDPDVAGGRIRSGGVDLAALVEADDIALHPTSAFVVGQVLVPRPSTPLQWIHGEPGTVGVTFEPDGEVDIPLGGWHATRRCSDVSLKRSKFDPFDAIGGHGLDQKAALSEDGPVPLAARAGGPTVARLSDVRDIVVLAARKHHSRIAWKGEQGLVSGWVENRYLARPDRDSTDDEESIGEEGTIGLGSLGTIGPAPAPSPPDDRVSCPVAIPLVAEAGAKRGVVGSIGPRVVMVIEPGLGPPGFASVHFPGAKIAVVSQARLLVYEDDLERCRAARAQPIVPR